MSKTLEEFIGSFKREGEYFRADLLIKRTAAEILRVCEEKAEKIISMRAEELLQESCKRSDNPKVNGSNSPDWFRELAKDELSNSLIIIDFLKSYITNTEGGE